MSGDHTFTDADRVTVAVICGALLVEVFLHSIDPLFYLLYPLRLLAVALHELGHCGVACCRKKNYTWEVSGTKGGETNFEGKTSGGTLLIGYVFSIVFGSGLVVAAFDRTAAFAAGIGLFLALLAATFTTTRTWQRVAMVLAMVLVLVLLWESGARDGDALRYLVAAAALPNCFFALFEMTDEVVGRAVRAPDLEAYGAAYDCCLPRWWGAVWLTISALAATAAVLTGVFVF